MKATGIVRRVDDLGRIVIPKEVRRQVKIREGQPLEFFILQEGDKMMVVIAHYDPAEEEEEEDVDACEQESLGNNWW